MIESQKAAERAIINLPAAKTAPKAFIAAALAAYIKQQHPAAAPEWNQSEHCRFLIYAISRLLPHQLDPDEIASSLAILESLGLGGNASQFKQHFADAKNGALLPAARKAGDLGLTLD